MGETNVYPGDHSGAKRGPPGRLRQTARGGALLLVGLAMVLRCGDARDGLCARLAAPCAAVAMARGWLLLSARDAGGSPDGAVLEMGCGAVFGGAWLW